MTVPLIPVLICVIMLAIGVAINVAIHKRLIYEKEREKFSQNSGGEHTDFPSRHMWLSMPHKLMSTALLTNYLRKRKDNFRTHKNVKVAIGPVNLVVDYKSGSNVWCIRGINWQIGSYNESLDANLTDKTVTYIGDGYFFAGSFEDYEEDLLVMRLCFEP